MTDPDPVLIATLIQLAEDNKELAIADDLRALAIRAGQYPDMPSTAALQMGLGVAEQAVYRKLNQILKVCEDNGAVVTEAFAKATDNELNLASALEVITGALQRAEQSDKRQEVAVEDLRRGFHTVAETLDDIANHVAVLKNNWIEQERHNREVARQLRDHTQQLAEHHADIADLKRYAAAVPADERRALVATIHELRQQYREILDRLPADAIDRET